MIVSGTARGRRRPTLAGRAGLFLKGTKTMAKAQVTLELSAVEAGVLLHILDHTGGDPNGPRGAVDSIKRVLTRLGVTYSGFVTGALTIDEQSP